MQSWVDLYCVKADPTFIMCAGIPQQMGDRNMDARISTADDFSASIKFGELRSSNPYVRPEKVSLILMKFGI